MKSIAAIEREQIIKCRPMEIEGARLHQPSSSKSAQSSGLLPPECTAIDPLVEHTIKLIKYNNQMKSLITNMKSQLAGIKKEDDESLKEPLYSTSIPQYEGKIPGRSTELFCHAKTNIDSAFCQGKGVAPPELNYEIVKKILTRSVAAIMAHIGFDDTSDVIVRILTDICHQYLSNMCNLLRAAVDREKQTGITGFDDVLEQVFHEIGIGSIVYMHDFYMERIIGHYENVLCTSQQLLAEYEQLKNSPLDSHQSDSLSLVKVKDEPLSDIHFPFNEDSEENVDSSTDHIQLPLDGLASIETSIEHEEPSAIRQEPVANINAIDDDSMGKINNIISIKQETSDSKPLDVDEDLLSIADSVGVHLADSDNYSVPSVSGQVKEDSVANQVQLLVSPQSNLNVRLAPPMPKKRRKT